MPTLIWIFLIAVLFSTVLRGWLSLRQARAVHAHRERVPEPFSATIGLDDHRKAADYTVAQVRLAQVDLVLDTVLLLLLTLGGGIGLIDASWRALDWPSRWHGVAVIMSVFLLMGAVNLPISLWRTFRIEARFGFNRMTPGLFVLDLLKGTAIAMALGIPLLWVILALMESAGGLWWLYAWAVWVAFGVLMSWAWPTFIAPLFNKFTPLADRELDQRIRALLARCKFSTAGVFVMNGSVRSAHGNAYFTGLGRHKRIVFFDTLLSRLSYSEIEAVLAHELGHYRLHHIRKHLVVSALTSLAGFAALGALTAWPGFYAALGVAPSPHAALLLFLLCSSPFLYFVTPLGAAWSRRHEFEADEFASKHADSQELVTALVKLYRDNATTLTPDRWHSRFYDSHPPALERIRFLQQLVRAG